MDEKQLEKINNLKKAYDSDDEYLKSKSFDEVWNSIEKYIISELKKCYHQDFTENQEDFMQEAKLIVWNKTLNYDPKKGAYTTFLAPYIRHIGTDWMKFKGITAHYFKLNKKINACIKNFEMQGKKSPTDDEIAKELECFPRTIRTCRWYMNACNKESLESKKYSNMYVQRQNNTPESVLLQKEYNEILQRALYQLPDMLRKVVVLKYGLDYYGEERSNAKVAAILELPVSEISKMLCLAKQELSSTLVAL